MSRNCRIGRSFRIHHLLYMPTIDLYILFINTPTPRATSIHLTRAEADRLVADLKGEFEVAKVNGEPCDFGEYKFTEHYKSLKSF